MKKQFAILTAALSISLAGCLEDWLVTTPQTILTDEQVYSDPNLITGMLADYYDRIGMRNQTNANHNSIGNYGEAMSSEAGVNNSPTGAPDVGGPGWTSGGFWGLLRDIHVTMRGVENSTASAVIAAKPQIMAELRFIRALHYFTAARAYGGMPIIEDQLIYDPAGDITTIQIPRASEAETWDYIFSELDAVSSAIGNGTSRNRGNAGAILALKSRAMLYAASVARYNNEVTPQLTMSANVAGTPGEAGIPASEAAAYFTKSLEASRELINGGTYALKQGANKTLNFATIFLDESSANTELIMYKGFSFAGAKIHHYTLRNVPQSMHVEKQSNWGVLNLVPTLNVVESFDRLDGSSGSMVGRGVGTSDLANNTGTAWTFFTTPGEIFQGYDPRMQATVLTPGGVWLDTGLSPSLQAGVYAWNGTTYVKSTNASAGATYTDQGIWTGIDGPLNSGDWTSRSGFAVHKFLDSEGNARRFSGGGGDTPEIWFRMGEIYLNAAEAAFELGLTAEALGYINTLRQRAGFPANSLAVINRDVIRKERVNELRYEDHFMWDQKRWRIAHTYWNGDAANENNRMLVLFPYRISRPGHPDHNKIVFNRHVSANNLNGRNSYSVNNYYSGIPGGARDGNPTLFCNPGQTC